MKYVVRLLWLITLLMSGCYQKQRRPEDVRFIGKIAENINSSNSCRDNLLFLTKTIGGRLSGTFKMTEAEKWGMKMFRKEGADTVWQQPCEVVHWERGVADSAFISYTDNNGKIQRKRISVLALGSTPGTGRNGLKARLARFSSFENLDSNNAEAGGKIVFFNPRFSPEGDPIREYSRLAGYRTQGPSKASASGAIGVIVRSLTNSIDSFPHIGMQSIDKNVPLIPSVSISTTDANLLDKLLDEGRQVDAEIYTYGQNFPDTTGNNIIAELKGSDFPDRYITVGAHLDSWDVGEGASDDGTGVIITIELLRALREAGYKPRNTIRFVLFADEENGLHGGSAYAKAAFENREKHLFAIESDAGAFSPFSIGVVGFSQEAEEKLKDFSYLFKPYDGGDWINSGAADITPLNQTLKIPIASLWSDQQKYFKVHHSPADTYENTDIDQVKNGAINVAIMLYLVDKYGLK